MAPRTTREALIAEMLGDIDALLSRCEAFSTNVDALQEQMTTTSATLDAAGERYRQVISTFTEQAKQHLVTYIERRAGEAESRISESEQKELEEAVVRAFRSALIETASKKHTTWTHLGELASVALVAGASSAACIYCLMYCR
jgi:hypothetical protein